MPVTFYPAASIQAESVVLRPIDPKLQQKTCAEWSLLQAHRQVHSRAKEILQSSFTDARPDPQLWLMNGSSGFVMTAFAAYNQHRALVLRPDDIWLAILCQFNFFVNANAERLRDQFVAHDGKKRLQIRVEGTRYSVDFAWISRTFTDLIQESVIDPDLRAWITPDFSTTTMQDVTISAITMMATMKEYFEYGVMCMCGLPKVTLEGTKHDYENILSRIEKLKQYGPETTAWYELLRPVLTRMVAAFDEPDSAANLDFWNRIAQQKAYGSGPRYLSGWMTAFTVFSAKGEWLGIPLDGSRTDRDFDALVLDGVKYHRIDTNDIPIGCAEVDIDLDDNGVKFDAVMLAGSVGYQITSSNDTQLSKTGKNDTIAPLHAWWMLTV